MYVVSTSEMMYNKKDSINNSVHGVIKCGAAWLVKIARVFFMLTNKLVLTTSKAKKI